MAYDQLIIGDVSSLEFDASVMQRTISLPAKKEIKQTVPFSNKTYDFSAIGGEVYWEQRELEYIMEIDASCPEELSAKKTRFFNWVMNVMDEEIRDPFDPDWHYVGTFKNITPEDDESVEKSTITVVFEVYPYKFANTPTVYVIPVPAKSEVAERIVNDSGHRLTPTLEANVEMTLLMSGASYTVPADEVTDDRFKLEKGATTLKVANQTNNDGLLKIEFVREVF